ncbi:MAG: hypothetical protein LBG97_07880 [Coriobacteriales bacterium]|nr:hypothetical protein [Coriobacteriales bacterium]
MATYQLEIFNGLPFIFSNGKAYLVDTSSPASGPSVLFEAKQYNANIGALDVTIKDLVNKIREGKNVTLDGVLGMDALAHGCLRISYADKVLEAGAIPERLSSKAKFKNLMGLVCIQINVGTEAINALLDTSSEYSYMTDEKFLQGCKSVGKIEDVMPELMPGMKLKRFTTELCEQAIDFEGESFVGRFGKLPAQAGTLLSLVGVEAILGFDFFNSFEVLLDFKNSIVSTRKY